MNQHVYRSYIESVRKHVIEFEDRGYSDTAIIQIMDEVLDDSLAEAMGLPVEEIRRVRDYQYGAKN